MVITNYLCSIRFYMFYNYIMTTLQYDFKYIHLVSGKSVGKKRVESLNFTSLLGSKTTETQFRKVIILIHGKKIFRNTFVADSLKIKVEKWNSSKLPM